MQTHQVPPTKDIAALISSLNQQLAQIALRLAKLEGNAGTSISLNADINLNGNKIINQG